jgi:hypothetical protein
VNIVNLSDYKSSKEIRVTNNSNKNKNHAELLKEAFKILDTIHKTKHC